MKTIRELFDNAHIGEQELIASLEAREAERDAAERERVTDKLYIWFGKNEKGDRVVADIYPPPKSEKLPAGWYWWKWKRDTEFDWHCEYLPDLDERDDDWEFRPWNDPPPEVTGNVEETNSWGKSARDAMRAKSGLPTFEEWTSNNIVNFDKSVDCFFKESYFVEPNLNIPDDVYDALEGGYRSSNGRIDYNTPIEANYFLKVALLKLRKIRL